MRQPVRHRHRCYISDCSDRARYEAHLTWTFGLMLLCEDHAKEERALQDVRDIRTLKEDP